MAEAKFDLKNQATRTLYAGAGVADLAVGAVREYVTDLQKRLAEVQTDVQTRVSGIELKPEVLRDQAVTVVSARVDALSKEAQARRTKIEARVAELQDEAKALPTRVQGFVGDNVATATSAYTDLAQRGQVLVGRIRRQESTRAAESAAGTTKAKAKTTATQATKATKATSRSTTTGAKSTASTAKKAATTGAKSTASTASKAATTTRKTAAQKSTAPRSSAKGTATAAKKTATATAKAAGQGAAKVGD